jgi:hypothetical protein
MESEKDLNRDFSFKDKHGEYQMSQELKSLCDTFGKEQKDTLNAYLFTLVHLGVDQKQAYSDPDAEISSTTASTMKMFVIRRDQLIGALGQDVVLELERWLGVDSQGVEAGDERPLLGFDQEIAIAVAHYIHPEEGYDSIT